MSIPHRKNRNFHKEQKWKYIQESSRIEIPLLAHHGVSKMLLLSKIFLRSLVQLQTKIAYPEEKKYQMIPHFSYAPKPWTKYPIKTRLLRAKEIMQENQDWLGYFFLGGYRNWKSAFIERFNPYSPYYQAWVGCYVIHTPITKNSTRIVGFEENGEPILDELATIGLGDQLAWLHSYGDPKPYVEVVKAEPLPPQNFHPLAQAAFLGEMWTHSDVNLNGSIDWRYNLIFGKPHPRILKTVEPYHDILMRGYYIAWCQPEKRITVISYGAVAAHFETKSGKTISHWDTLNEELKRVIKSLKMLPRKIFFSTIW